MGLIDEETQIVRRAVEMTRREKVHAVVTPAEASRKITDRHHFQQRDAVFFEQWQFLRRRAPRSFLSKRADMKLIDDLARELRAAPILIRPAKLRWIDNARRTMWSVRLMS